MSTPKPTTSNAEWTNEETALLMRLRFKYPDLSWSEFHQLQGHHFPNRTELALRRKHGRMVSQEHEATRQLDLVFENARYAFRDASGYFGLRPRPSRRTLLTDPGGGRVPVPGPDAVPEVDNTGMAGGNHAQGDTYSLGTDDLAQAMHANSIWNNADEPQYHIEEDPDPDPDETISYASSIPGISDQPAHYQTGSISLSAAPSPLPPMQSHPPPRTFSPVPSTTSTPPVPVHDIEPIAETTRPYSDIESYLMYLAERGPEDRDEMYATVLRQARVIYDLTGEVLEYEVLLWRANARIRELEGLDSAGERWMGGDKDGDGHGGFEE
ncbi:hypothetical protein BJX76DRAFT_362389 [Aspergillus varians]